MSGHDSDPPAEPFSCQCQRYIHCSAPICPLDPECLTEAKHLAGERICSYVTELCKPDGAATLRQFLELEIAEWVIERGPLILERFSSIRRVCARSALNPSKLKNWHARKQAANQQAG